MILSDPIFNGYPLGLKCIIYALQTSEVSGRSNLNFQCKPLLAALHFLMQGPQKCLTVYLQLKKEIESLMEIVPAKD